MQTDTKKLAKQIRLRTLDMIQRGGGSHIGSVFSVTDIIAVLYGSILRVKPDNPQWRERDRFILSKGHAGAAVYAVLAEQGFFDEKLLDEYYKDGSIMSGHVSHKEVPGVEWSTGSLGHGLSVAVGIAKAALLDGKEHRVFVVQSDGECDEGTTWEAVLFAAHHKLDNLCLVIDYNKMQCIAPTQEALALEPLARKWESFGWSVQEVDGHDHEALASALSDLPKQAGKPTVIIAHTKRGKGVSFMEKDGLLWYFRSPQGEEYAAAKKELEALP